MNKNLTAFAVAFALATPAATLAQSSNVQIYGRLNLGFDNYSATGATAGSAADFKSRYRVYDAASRLGFTGSEDLGNGLKAVFLMESGVNVDNGGNTGQSGVANPFSGFLSSRVGHVGLQGNWGLLTFGKSNVWWANYAQEQVSANFIATGMPSFNGLFGRGMGVGVTRVTNTIQYTSPTLSGVSAIVSYSPNGEASGAGANADGRLWGLTVHGQWGAFGAGYDWVKNRGNAPAAGGTPVSTGHKLRAGMYYAPGSQVSLMWIKSVQDNGGAIAIVAGAGAAALLLPDPTATASLSQTSWGLNWEHTFGNIQGFAQWAKVNNITGCVLAGRCDNTNATSWLLAARYNFSKRTGAYFQYTTVKNASNYNMDYSGGWMTSAGTLGLLPGLPPGSVGADPRIYGIGIMHNF